ncbi:MAG: ATP synthase F1 subunit gamma [Candidatus Saccharimonadales bacterium]
MASRQQLKHRIGSVKSTKQITKAMQMVAASKLRKAQDAANGPREYAQLSRELLTHLRSLQNEAADRSQLFEIKPIKKRLLVIISSNRGLAGAYNSNVLRQMIKEMQADKTAGITTSLLTIGKKASAAAARIQGANVIAAYNDLPDQPTTAELLPILDVALGTFVNEEIDAVDVIFTQFISSMRQEVQVRRLLPAGFEEEEVSSDIARAKIEPSVDELLEAVTLRLLQVQLYQTLLESAASEQSMRMIAMKNATDNAKDIIDDLTLEFNTARQAAITQEIAEISGGAEAMK